MTKNYWLNYWDKKNIWKESGLWKKNVEIFFQKTSDIFNFKKEMNILDIGCGNGDFATRISEKVGQVFCVDTSKEYVSICKNRFLNKKNIYVFLLGDNYTDLSFLKKNKFSIIFANSVVQYYNSQKEIIDLVKSAKNIAEKDAYFLISDIEVHDEKKKSYLKLIYNSVINGYFFSLIKMGLKLFINKDYAKTKKLQPLLIVNLNELIEDLSVFCKKASVVNENITANVDRKHLLIEF